MAPISCQCPHCGQVLTTDTAFSGQVVGCPACYQNFVVPPMAPVHTPPIGYWSPTQVATYAGFWKRFAALLIDGFLLTLVMCALAIPLIFASGEVSNIQRTGRLSPGIAVLLNIALPSLQWLYFTLQESSSKQATIGKQAMGIVVTDLNGQRISFGRANARYWSKLLSGIICSIGYLMAAFTEKKQALHDILAQCLVVKR